MRYLVQLCIHMNFCHVFNNHEEKYEYAAENQI